MISMYFTVVSCRSRVPVGPSHPSVERRHPGSTPRAGDLRSRPTASLSRRGGPPAGGPTSRSRAWTRPSAPPGRRRRRRPAGPVPGGTARPRRPPPSRSADRAGDGQRRGGGDDVVDEAVLAGLLGGEPAVAVGVALDLLDALPGVLGLQVVDVPLEAPQHVGLDGDVGLRAPD